MDRAPPAQVTDLTAAERVERIMTECATPLGFAMRGVSSWDYEYLIEWRGKAELSYNDLVRLMEIENQVFG